MARFYRGDRTINVDASVFADDGVHDVTSIINKKMNDAAEDKHMQEFVAGLPEASGSTIAKIGMHDQKGVELLIKQGTRGMEFCLADGTPVTNILISKLNQSAQTNSFVTTEAEVVWVTASPVWYKEPNKKKDRKGDKKSPQPNPGKTATSRVSPPSKPKQMKEVIRGTRGIDPKGKRGKTE